MCVCVSSTNKNTCVNFISKKKLITQIIILAAHWLIAYHSTHTHTHTQIKNIKRSHKRTAANDKYNNYLCFKFLFFMIKRRTGRSVETKKGNAEKLFAWLKKHFSKWIDWLCARAQLTFKTRALLYTYVQWHKVRKANGLNISTKCAAAIIPLGRTHTLIR